MNTNTTNLPLTFIATLREVVMEEEAQQAQKASSNSRWCLDCGALAPLGTGYDPEKGGYCYKCRPHNIKKNK